MGGDFGPSVTLPAVSSALSQNAALSVTLLGGLSEIKKSESCYRNLEQLQQSFSSRVYFIDCEDIVSMSDKPSVALRSKQNSSLYKTVALVADNGADGCISAGNTGALMAIGCFLLKTFPGIDRPAICTEIPNEVEGCYLLDLGANVDSCSEHLMQFAVMGSVAAATLKGKPEPKVGLLNIGEEEIKGNEQVKLAANLLEKNQHLNYIGYVEGSDVFSGKADVIVCDGFVGNVLVKASEGVARLVVSKMRASFRRNVLTRFFAFLSRGVLDNLRDEINPSRYNGASFLGLQKTVVVSHGSADIDAFCRAIQLAYFEAAQDLPKKINRQLAMMNDE